MKVLIVSLFNSWVTHFGTELEIAQRHLDAGDEVEFLGCDGCIQFCAANPRGKISKCDRCRLRRREGLKLLSKTVVEHRLGEYLPADMQTTERELAEVIQDVSSAEAYTFDGHDLGAGALSSSIWRVRDPLLQTGKARRLLANYARGAVRAYRATKSFLAAHPGYDRAYVFNGRLGCTRGVFRACRAVAGMETYTHERGSTKEKFTVFRNAMPHNRELWRSETLRAWDEAPDPVERERIGRSFFEERRGGVAVAWSSFTKGQDTSLRPEGFDAAKTAVVIFNSSEDEFVGLGPEWRNPVYESQSEGIERIVTESLKRHPEMHFYVRMHPNLRGVENGDVARLRGLAARGLPNLTVIEPESKISSYTMLDLADTVVTFGSTMGVEAAFWGKRSIMAGHSFYEDLGSVYVASGHDELMDLIARRPAPLPVLGALKYAYYARTHGSVFRYWKPSAFHDGEYRGQTLAREPGNWLACRLKVLGSDAFRRRPGVVSP